MERKSVNPLAGLTHADSVNADDKFSEFESITVTFWLMPSKRRAFPLIPDIHDGPLSKVPLLPFPELSAATVPAPSSKFQ